MEQKEMFRQLMLQIAGLAGIFGYASARVRSGVKLLQDLATNHWDEVWAIATGSDSTHIRRILANVRGAEHDASDPFDFVGMALPTPKAVPGSGNESQGVRIERGPTATGGKSAGDEGHELGENGGG